MCWVEHAGQKSGNFEFLFVIMHFQVAKERVEKSLPKFNIVYAKWVLYDMIFGREKLVTNNEVV